MINIRNYTKKYGEKVAVSDLNLNIMDGEVYGLIGHNGAGKSTTIKAITGVIEPDQGDIQVAGYDILKDGMEAKMNIGYVSDSPDRFLKLTSTAYYNFIGDIFGIDYDTRVQRIETIMQTLEMEGTGSQLIGEMSHGMRQKVFIIGALLPKPKVWILDEPMTGLDPSASFNLKQMIRKHADQGNTVLFSTHVLDTAEKLCDRIGILSHGKLIYEGTMEDLEKMDAGNSLEEIYLNLIKKQEDVRNG